MNVAATVMVTAIEQMQGRDVNTETALKEAMAIGGATGDSWVDGESGMLLGALSEGKSYLAMARHALKRIESELVL